MKIDNSGKPISGTLPRTLQNKVAVPEKKTEATQQESVNINPLAAKMHAQEANASAAPFDANKVAAIRHAISEGKYTIQADAIAEKLMSSVRELLER